MWFCSEAGEGALALPGLPGWLPIRRPSESDLCSLRRFGRDDVTGRRRRLGMLEGWWIELEDVA